MGGKTGKVRYTPAEIREKIRDIAKQSYGSQRKAAHNWGVSEQFLSGVILGKRSPSDKILDAIGATKVDVSYFEFNDPASKGDSDL